MQSDKIWFQSVKTSLVKLLILRVLSYSLGIIVTEEKMNEHDILERNGIEKSDVVPGR